MARLELVLDVAFEESTPKWHYRLRRTSDKMTRWEKSKDKKRWSAAESVPTELFLRATAKLSREQQNHGQYPLERASN